ncbi:hypothetical protein RIF29_05793 [Crotalaria pallida]|uniref:Uncharacterized protein n=1 Tax=Crotalaria pallida TaxID=3830 RepID=A0AAN9P9Y9_CROPI
MFLLIFSTMEFNELKNASAAEPDRANSNSFTPTEESCAYTVSDVDASESDEVSLDELLLDGRAMKKIELLAAMVGVDSPEPAIVLTEVVRILKVLEKMNE